MVTHHQRSGDISLLTLQEIEKFWLSGVCTSSPRVCTHSFQPEVPTKGNVELSLWAYGCVQKSYLFHRSDTEAYSLQPQSGATYSTYLPCFLFSDLSYDTDVHFFNTHTHTQHHYCRGIGVPSPCKEKALEDRVGWGGHKPQSICKGHNSVNGV